jgi:hypothetical protein
VSRLKSAFVTRFGARRSGKAAEYRRQLESIRPTVDKDFAEARAKEKAAARKAAQLRNTAKSFRTPKRLVTHHRPHRVYVISRELYTARQTPTRGGS